MTPTTRSRYAQLLADREPYLNRARHYAELTIPSLLPQEGSSGGTKFPTPYQSVGARGLLTLAAKAIQAVMPPNQPFFRLDIEEFTLSELSEDPQMRQQVEDALAMTERTVMRHIESSAVRVGFYEGILHLILSGNVLMFREDDGSFRAYPLSHYVVLRDPSGNLLELITMEEVGVETLPEEIQRALAEAKGEKTAEGASKKKRSIVKLYTHVTREGKVFKVKQCVEDVPVPNSEGTFNADNLPWLPLRWNRVDGESYGRGHIEPIWGDLKTLEGITKAIMEYAAGAAKVIPLVNPNGVTDEKDLSDAENFEFVPGIASDISFVRIDKYPDLQVAKQLADDLVRRCEFHFLMNNSVQRSAERVTAEEIRFMAADLEATIGAVYVLLAQEFQLPLVKITMEDLVKKKRLPALPKDLVQPTVTTGIDALSRLSDLGKLDRMVAGLRDLYGPEALAQETNVGDYVARRAAALGIDPTGLIKTPEQKAAEAKMRQQAEMMKLMGPNMVNQAGQMAQKGME